MKKLREEVDGIDAFKNQWVLYLLNIMVKDKGLMTIVNPYLV